jgi:hypothetical protein
MSAGVHPPRLFWIPLRVLLVTVLFGLMTFAVSLLLGILGTVVWAGLHHAPLNLTVVYRRFAPVAAGMVAGVALVSTAVVEVRHYRQARALAAIERMG